MTRVRLSLCLPAPESEIDSSWSSLAAQSPGALKAPRAEMILSPCLSASCRRRKWGLNPAVAFPCHSAMRVSSLAGIWAHPRSRMSSDTLIPRFFQASPPPPAANLLSPPPSPFPPSTVFVCTSVCLPDFIQPTSQTFTCRQGCPKCNLPGDLLCELCSKANKCVSSPLSKATFRLLLTHFTDESTETQKGYKADLGFKQQPQSLPPPGSAVQKPCPVAIDPLQWSTLQQPQAGATEFL